MGMVELRWSNECRTNWSRVTSSLPNTSVKLRAYLRDKDGNVLNHTLQEAEGNQIYGDMWYAPTTYVKACGVIGTGKEACTKLR
jgi:hypothetical protein